MLLYYFGRISLGRLGLNVLHNVVIYCQRSLELAAALRGNTMKCIWCLQLNGSSALDDKLEWTVAFHNKHRRKCDAGGHYSPEEPRKWTKQGHSIYLFFLFFISPFYLNVRSFGSTHSHTLLLSFVLPFSSIIYLLSLSSLIFPPSHQNVLLQFCLFSQSGKMQRPSNCYINPECFYLT